MRLSDLEKYNPITIQCHDNPDADTIGAGYGLYCYFKSRQKDVRLFYSGSNKIQKTNLRLMQEKLEIPIEYFAPEEKRHFEGLLITVDCQYGAGNVTKFTADEVAIIDHHAVEIKDVEKSRIQPGLGSCATLVWSMLGEEKFSLEGKTNLGTALYYGLYMDTSQFAEIFNPLDMDMWESLPCNRSLITLFRNSNLSLRELETAGIAMIRSNYNEDYHFAVIKSQPCAPNILGLISDFLIQVDEVETCVVYNEGNDGYKYSVRSCVKEVNASELAGFLAEGIGSGGGHFEKAGGFISKKLFHENFPNLHSEGYFNNRMMAYFDSFSVVYAGEEKLDLSDMEVYARKYQPICYVNLGDIFPAGTVVNLRTRAGDRDVTVREGLHVIMERDGKCHLYEQDNFNWYFNKKEDKMPERYYDRMSYAPSAKSMEGGKVHLLTDYAKVCFPSKRYNIYAKPLKKGIKVFNKNEENYRLGVQGDYLAVTMDDRQYVFIVDKNSFSEKFEQITL